MPVDPSISLNVVGGKGGPADAGWAGGNALSPMDMVGKFADTQAKLNANKLFAQTFQARQKLGQIMATAADIPSGLETANKDPDVAAFVPDLAGTIASTLNTMQSYKGQVRQYAHDAYHDVLSVLPTGLVDPKMLHPAVAGAIANIPDLQMRNSVGKTAGDLVAALSDGLPDGPAGQAEFAKRLMALGSGTGTLDSMSKLSAAPIIVPLGSTAQPGTQAGPIPTIVNSKPGAFTPAGKELDISGAPGPVDPNALYGGLKPKGGINGAGGGGGGNALDPGSPKAGKPASESDASSAEAGDGSPLFPKGYKYPAGSGGAKNLGGGPANPQEAQAADDLVKDYTGRGKNIYDNAVRSLPQLAEMEKNFDNLVKGGGFLQSGTMGETRLGVAKLFNSVAQAFGGDTLPVDPGKVASAEDIIKGTQRLAPNVLQTLLGDQQHAAAETLNNMIKAVPSIENSPLGAKLLIGSLRAASQRQISLRNFQNKWRVDHQGDLSGAEEEFNNLHPAEKFLQPVLKEFGLNDSGTFKSRDEIKRMVKMGYMSPQQGHDAAIAQGLQ